MTSVEEEGFYCSKHIISFRERGMRKQFAFVADCRRDGSGSEQGRKHAQTWADLGAAARRAEGEEPRPAKVYNFYITYQPRFTTLDST